MDTFFCHIGVQIGGVPSCKHVYVIFITYQTSVLLGWWKVLRSFSVAHEESSGSWQPPI